MSHVGPSRGHDYPDVVHFVVVRPASSDLSRDCDDAVGAATGQLSRLWDAIVFSPSSDPADSSDDWSPHHDGEYGDLSSGRVDEEALGRDIVAIHTKPLTGASHVMYVTVTVMTYLLTP